MYKKMTPEELHNHKEFFRKKFNLSADEVIPDFVELLPREQKPLTGRDLEWAQKVAAEFEAGIRG